MAQKVHTGSDLKFWKALEHFEKKGISELMTTPYKSLRNGFPKWETRAINNTVSTDLIR